MLYVSFHKADSDLGVLIYLLVHDSWRERGGRKGKGRLLSNVAKWKEAILKI